MTTHEERIALASGMAAVGLVLEHFKRIDQSFRDAGYEEWAERMDLAAEKACAAVIAELKTGLEVRA